MKSVSFVVGISALLIKPRQIIGFESFALYRSNRINYVKGHFFNEIELIILIICILEIANKVKKSLSKKFSDLNQLFLIQ